MVLRKVLTVTAVLLAGATFAAPAVATPTVVDQYTEQIPTPGGEAPGQTVDGPVPGQGNSGGQAGDPGDPSGVAPGSSDTAVVTPGTAGSDGGSGTGGSQPAADNQSSGAGTGSSVPFGGESSAQGGDPGSGLGALFPVALLLIAGLAVAAALSRRRAGTRAGTS